MPFADEAPWSHYIGGDVYDDVGTHFLGDCLMMERRGIVSDQYEAI